MKLHPELHQQYFKRVADLNCKPCQNQQPENEFKTVLMEKMRYFQMICKKKVLIIVSSFRLSIATQCSTNLPVCMYSVFPIQIDEIIGKLTR